MLAVLILLSKTFSSYKETLNSNWIIDYFTISIIVMDIFKYQKFMMKIVKFS